MGPCLGGLVPLKSGVCPPELPYPESWVSACFRFEPRTGIASPLRGFEEGVVCDREIGRTSFGELRELVPLVLDRCLDRDPSFSSCAFIVATPAGAELWERMAGGHAFGTSMDGLLPFDERGCLSLSLPLSRPDCQSSGDSQYDREELVRPDTLGLCERSRNSLAFL